VLPQTGDGGGGVHLLEGARPTFRTTSTPRPSEERVPTVHTVGTPRPSVPGAPAAGSFAPSYEPLAPAPALRRARTRARGVGGSDPVTFTAAL
jgi:hypothetical protein